MSYRPHKVKCEMVSQDGETWLVTHQYYLADLESGKFVDGTGLQGKQFRLVRKGNENGNEQLPRS